MRPTSGGFGSVTVRRAGSSLASKFLEERQYLIFGVEPATVRRDRDVISGAGAGILVNTLL
jgi:hypothetical protein